MTIAAHLRHDRGEACDPTLTHCDICGRDALDDLVEEFIDRARSQRYSACLYCLEKAD